MGNLHEQIMAEKENVERVLKNLKKVMVRGKKTIIELAAMATFLHNIYNGIENILKQVLKAKGIVILKSESWHKDILNTALTNGIITPNLYDCLIEYLAFRHFFIYAYGFTLKESHLKPLADKIENVWKEFISQIIKLTKNYD